jgi:hypothetical protein
MITQVEKITLKINRFTVEETGDGGRVPDWPGVIA